MIEIKEIFQSLHKNFPERVYIKTDNSVFILNDKQHILFTRAFKVKDNFKNPDAIKIVIRARIFNELAKHENGVILKDIILNTVIDAQEKLSVIVKVQYAPIEV